MKLRKLLFFLTLLLTGVGIYLRAMNLHTGYEMHTGLPKLHEPYATALVWLSVGAAMLILLLSQRYRSFHGVFFLRAFGTGSKVYQTVGTLCALAMGIVAGFGYYDMMQTANQRTEVLSVYLSAFPLWFLATLSMFAMFRIIRVQASGKMNAQRAIFSLVPMFWACFDLIMTFKENGASPFVSLYAYELFAAVCLLFAFYSMAGFLYAQSNPPRFVWASLLAFYFCWVCLGGALLSMLMGGSILPIEPKTMLRYACFGASSLYLFANFCVISKNLTYQPKH